MSELEADKLVDGAIAWRAPPAPPRRRRLAVVLGNAWHELRKSRTASIGAVMLVLLFGACIATPWPSARAVSTYSLLSSSSIEERVSRVVNAACRKPMAAAGRIRNCRLPQKSSSGLT